ncbi:xanthine dehydrogenase family protein molybdopterin-binding subunit [Kitasatospora sp. NPDC004614]|uniref:xanthine dehydrogenase family protein molybdopterin-binding subunit n=1 Tax=Kitasatospora sp. NPDC004614 TaxID=3364016 RepID=UPI00368F40D1
MNSTSTRPNCGGATSSRRTGSRTGHPPAGATTAGTTPPRWTWRWKPWTTPGGGPSRPGAERIPTRCRWASACPATSNAPAGNPADCTSSAASRPRRTARSSSGAVVVRCGAACAGQGCETVFPALVAEALGVDASRVRLVEGDTGEQPEGLGSFASRSAQVAGAMLRHTSRLLVAEARERAARLWDVPSEAVGWSDGAAQLGPSGSQAIGLAELVRATGPLRVDDRFETGMAFPFGTHAVVAEVDPELGTVRLLRVVAVDDCGVQLNPVIVRGQAFGSAVQGIGQALYEGIPYRDDGVPLLASGLLDYLLPTFTEVPSIEVRDTCTPGPGTPLGAKGAGESGCIGTPAAVVNAVVDALRIADPDLLQMPLTPDVVWRAARAPKLTEAPR